MAGATMFIPALSFLRFLGMSLGPLAWLVFAIAVVWFVDALRHAPPDRALRAPHPVPEGRAADSDGDGDGDGL